MRGYNKFVFLVLLYSTIAVANSANKIYGVATLDSGDSTEFFFVEMDPIAGTTKIYQKLAEFYELKQAEPPIPLLGVSMLDSVTKNYYFFDLAGDGWGYNILSNQIIETFYAVSGTLQPIVTIDLDHTTKTFICTYFDPDNGFCVLTFRNGMTSNDVYCFSLNSQDSFLTATFDPATHRYYWFAQNTAGTVIYLKNFLVNNTNQVTSVKTACDPTILPERAIWDSIQQQIVFIGQKTLSGPAYITRVDLNGDCTQTLVPKKEANDGYTSFSYDEVTQIAYLTTTNGNTNTLIGVDAISGSVKVSMSLPWQIMNSQVYHN